MTLPRSELLAKITAERVTEITKAVVEPRHPEGREGRLAEVVAGLLDREAIDVLVDPVMPERPNVIARVRGTDSSGQVPGLLLNAHLDAGYVADGWSHDPHDAWVLDGRIHGGAITDMLGGLASMIATLEVAADAHLPGDVVLLANMYHDSNGLGTKYALATGDPWPAYGINGEPTSCTILTAHGGCVKFEIRFRGQVAHVSRHEDGADAVAAAVDVHRRLRSAPFHHDPHPDLPALPTFVLGQLTGGRAPGTVPDSATLRGDIRTVPGMDWASIRADLEAAIRDACPPNVATSIHCLVRQRPFLGPSGGRLFDSLRAGHYEVFGVDPAVNVDRAAQSFVTDAVDMAAAGIESIVYGPAAWHLVPDESVEIAELVAAARVYLATASRLMEPAG